MNRFAAVRNLANMFVRQFNLVPPVDLEMIYNQLGIELIEEENQLGIEAYSNLSGELSVYINTEITYLPRRRFTLAHELGHICIPWHNGDVKCNTDNNYVQIDGKRLLDTQELEANYFASEILMPTMWINEQINLHLGSGFFNLIEAISRNANTSIIASLYAVEEKLPSGHMYFAVNKNKDYWMTFKSPDTVTVSWQYTEGDNISFLDKVCINKTEKEYSYYHIIHYLLLQCPTEEVLNRQYCSCGNNVQRLLNLISNSNPLRCLTFLDSIVQKLQTPYAIFVIRDDKIIKRIYDPSSPAKYLCHVWSINAIKDICRLYQFETESFELDDGYRIVAIKGIIFEVPMVEVCDPNYLLRRLVYDICYEDPKHLLQSINGTIASVNGNCKNASRDELYNMVKYKFVLSAAYNAEYANFITHPEFEKYIVNKIDSMIAMRR